MHNVSPLCGLVKNMLTIEPPVVWVGRRHAMFHRTIDPPAVWVEKCSALENNIASMCYKTESFLN